MEHEQETNTRFEEADFVARQRMQSMLEFRQRHPSNVESLLAKGLIDWIGGNLMSAAAHALTVAQYQQVVRGDSATAREWLQQPDGIRPGFAECVGFLKEAVQGERPWNQELFTLDHAVEPVICYLLLDDLQRLADEYAVVLAGEPLFRDIDSIRLRATLARHLILHSQGRGVEVNANAYIQPVKRDKGPVFRDCHLLLLALNNGDADQFNIELANRCIAFRKRKSSRLIHSEWGFGSAAVWCFDTMGTAICRLAHRQGLGVANPDPRIYPEIFWSQ